METLINSYIAALGGLLLLSYCADTLVESSIVIARRLKLSKVFIGVTIIGFGSSLPEVLTTTTASLADKSDLAISTVIGSNIANIGLLLAFCLPISKAWPDMTKNKPELIFFSVSYIILVTSIFLGGISQIQGILMVALLVIFLMASLKINKSAELDVDEHRSKDESNIIELILGVAIGLVGLGIGADLLISGSTEIARDLGISEKVIGLTLVALGTSLPELAASINAAKKGEAGLVIGNIVGSNMFNILGALGIAATAKSLNINNFNTDAIFLIIIACLLLPFFFRKTGNNKLYALLLLAVYSTYIYMVVA